jgi:hypothetical protein
MIAPHPAGRLGWRLRVYLAIVAARSLGMGATYWASAPRIWRSPAFDVIEQLAPLRTFAVLWLALGLVAVGGVLFPGERGIRGVLVTSFGLELLFGLGVLLGTLSSVRRPRRSQQPASQGSAPGTTSPPKASPTGPPPTTPGGPTCPDYTPDTTAHHSTRRCAHHGPPGSNGQPAGPPATNTYGTDGATPTVAPP